ncbi:MAG TPA: dTDP-4-dehydrorhamnose reductase [Gemmataceae bacterium]|nr:dTDP-4-dehydrorhamnose reductase [Gemmataceae bacterium]
MSALKYAVLGANGQLGQAFLRALGQDATGLTRDQVDLTQSERMRAVLEKLRPEVVVNCTAYNGVDAAESDLVTPFAVNAWGVRDLARICQDLGCVLVHFSTNYVFGLDRVRRSPLGETDLPGPVGVYGASKLAGEYLARAACARQYVIRTTGLFGVVRPGSTRASFVELMLRLAGQGQPIRVVNDQICSPTRTDDLAMATLALLGTGAYGLYQLTSAGECTWHEFARTIFDMVGARVDLRAVASDDFGSPARRPEYSVMANEAYGRLGLAPIRHWKDALAQYLGERVV